MDEERVRYAVEGMKFLTPASYEEFEKYGDQTISALDEAAKTASRFATVDELLDEIDNSPPSFVNIINLLGRAELIETWNSSPPFKVYTEDFDSSKARKAYELVTGNEYSPENDELEEPEMSTTDRELLEKIDTTSDDLLRASAEYENP